MNNNVTVLIPTPLREFTDGESEVEAKGQTVREILDDLEDQYPGIKERLCTEDDELREFLNIYMNDEDIRFQDELDTQVNEGDDISIIPAIAGGKDKFQNYDSPEVLVTTQWVEDRLDDFQSADDDYRLIEVDVDTNLYDESHAKGAIGWDWEEDLCDTVQRDLLSKDDFELLMESSGITNDTTVVLYGDNNNWFAAWAFWEMKYYGHEDVRMMDGGRALWLDENHPTTTEVPDFPSTSYQAKAADESIRAYALEIDDWIKKNKIELVDVRSEPEFTGEKIAPEGLDETAQRGGHIPGATNISWSEAVNDDGTFKSVEELENIYEEEGITDDKKTVAYCRIGERSSHSWFVLKYLLGHEDVENYDGSWTEWGSRVGVEIETGE